MNNLKKSSKIYIKIAGFNIRLILLRENDMFEYEEIFIRKIKKYYEQFLISRPKMNDFTIEIIHQRTFKMMYQNRLKNVYINLYRHISPNIIQTYFHLSGDQFQTIIRRITHELLVKNQGFILHASAVRQNENAYIFLGESGAGKSTITQLLKSKFSITADDSIIIRKEKEIFYFYASSAIERNSFVPKNFKRLNIKGVFFLKKSDQNRLQHLNNSDDILKLLAAQLYSEKEDMITQMKYVIELINSFDKFFFLHFSLKNKSQIQVLLNNV